MIMQLLISILLGLIPEVLYFTMFLISTKDLKDKKIRLGILISIVYALCMFVQRYESLYYIVFVALVYIILKVLYRTKAQIIDVFVISISSIYVTILAIAALVLLKYTTVNYYFLMFINRIFLFTPFIFKGKFNIFYKKYCKLWNRNDNEIRPIKSITLRNISLISLNLLIVIINISCLYILNLK